jgi:hypothetical protein
LTSSLRLGCTTGAFCLGFFDLGALEKVARAYELRVVFQGLPDLPQPDFDLADPAIHLLEAQQTQRGAHEQIIFEFPACLLQRDLVAAHRYWVEL